ncbi:hypothetical protein L3Q82_006984 [Scortum barcoo]|uniref:Uncharacterized protein n=1 Tax=Scortum barcoo TaxID=214431 RepID=A0ACB8WZI9_9TELE|nr:hypothetical protein L3Q82_006984 [Scortum barcoo]
MELSTGQRPHGRRLRDAVTRTIQQWSDQSDSALRDCFSTTEWCVFKDTDINTYTDAVIGYIGKCIDDAVPRITVRLTLPNQKPWVNGEVHAKLKARTDAYNSGDLEEYRKSRYALGRAISSAKRQYRDKVESHYKGSNTRSMWAGLKTLTDYKKKISSAEVMSASLPDELNTFYARFESTSPAVEVQKAQEDHCPPVITRADVCRSFKQINSRKAPGPDGIPGRALKVCADQLADVFADIFNMSLLQSVVPTCFKETIIVPKKTKILCLNDDRPVALTSTIMKCFERLVKSFITSSIPDSLDPLQFAYRPNRSTEDAIALTLHTQPCKALQRVVKAAQHITRTELPSMEDLYTQRCRKKATKIIKDPSHPATNCHCQTSLVLSLLCVCTCGATSSLRSVTATPTVGCSSAGRASSVFFTRLGGLSTNAPSTVATLFSRSTETADRAERETSVLPRE